MWRTYRCKNCKTKNPIEWERIIFWVSRFCSKKCRQEFTRSIVKKNKEKIKVRKAKKKEKKANSISVLSKKADKLWSKVVRMIWVCEYEECEKTEHLNAHHVFSRSHKGLRWSLINGICLCSWHHVFSSEFSAHKTPCEFTYWLEEKKGKHYMNKLIEQKRQYFKVTPEYLLNTIKEFQDIIDSNK